MILTRDKGSRMWSGGGGTGSSGGGGGLDPSALAGYATTGWVEDNYISKAFFNQLFEYQYNHRMLTKDGETVVSDVTTAMVAAPNEVVDTTSHTETDEETGYTIITTNTITGIKAKAGLWTNQYMSALGQNSGGGGGGGATALSELVDVALSSPTNGQVLMYNSTTNKWYNGTVQSGSSAWADITGKPNTISGYGITDAYISGGTITIGSNSITPLTSSDLSGYATQQWVINQGFLTSASLSGYATQQWVINQGFLTSASLSDYATQQWVINQGFLTGISSSMVTNALGYTPMSNAVTFWGQSVSNGAVSGSLTNVGNITSSTVGSIINFNAIEFAATGTAESGNGGALYFHFPGVFGHASSYIIEQSEGVLSLLGAPPTGGNFGVVVGGANGTYLQIGGIRLAYDSTNNALMVQKSDGTAANLYATGAVSALGFSAGTSAVDAMTFGYLKVNSQLTLPTMIVAGSGQSVVRQAGDSDCVYLFNSSAQSKINSKSYYYNQYDNVGLCGTSYNYDETWWIDPDGCARFRRLYLDATRYLYVSSGTLYYYNGSSSKQVAFTN